MLVERAEMLIKDGMEADFATVMTEKGIPILQSIPGVGKIQFGRGVENPDKFILLVEWDSIEAHGAFAQMPIFPDFRGLLMPFSKGGAMEHFEIG